MQYILFIEFKSIFLFIFLNFLKYLTYVNDARRQNQIAGAIQCYILGFWKSIDRFEAKI